MPKINKDNWEKHFPNLRYADLSDANLSYTNLNNTILTDVIFANNWIITKLNRKQLNDNS